MIVENILNYKELIALIPPAVTGVALLVLKILQYSKASTYSAYYKVPVELFDKVNVMRTVESISLIAIMLLFLYVPFIALNWVDENYETLVFVSLFTFFYGAIIFSGLVRKVSWGCIVKQKALFVLILDLLVSAGITFVLVYLFDGTKNCALTCLFITYVVFLIFYIIVCIWTFIEYNPSLEKVREFSIIDQEEIEKLKIKVERGSVLLVVDYLRDNKMIVKECVEKGDSLILKSKFWMVNGEGVGVTIKEFKKGIERD